MTKGGGERFSSVTIPKLGEKLESGALHLSILHLHFSYLVLGYNRQLRLFDVDVQQSSLVVSHASWSQHVVKISAHYYGGQLLTSHYTGTLV